MRKNRQPPWKTSNGAILCWLVLVIAVCLLVKLLTTVVMSSRIEQSIKKIFVTEKNAAAVLQLELGITPKWEGIYAVSVGGDSKQETENDIPTGEEENEEHAAESGIPDYIADAAAQNKSEKLNYERINIFDSEEHLDSTSVLLDNDTGIEIDVDELLNSNLNFTVNINEPTVLIVHTHGSEAYTAEGEDMYIESDPYRTENNSYNVVRVGEELKKELEGYGISVLHDTTLHDYPSYNGSYNRSFETIAKYIEEYPTIKIVIDLHRDAIANADGTQYRTTVQIGEETCSQLLFVMGTNASGLEHPAWRENMKLAVKLQYAMNSMYPNLVKPICVSQYRYNQHMTSGSMILEVGSTGNTLKESLNSMKYFASAAAQVINSVLEKDN